MSRVINAVKGTASKVKNGIGNFWNLHGDSIKMGVMTVSALYGVTSFAWDVSGGRKFEQQSYRNDGFREGFLVGQKDAANLIGTAHGNPPIK